MRDPPSSPTRRSSDLTRTVPRPPGCVIVPAVAELPSPQLIVAVKSLTGAVGLASVNVATAPESSEQSTSDLDTLTTDECAPPTVAVLGTEATLPPTSV